MKIVRFKVNKTMLSAALASAQRIAEQAENPSSPRPPAEVIGDAIAEVVEGLANSVYVQVEDVRDDRL